MIQIIPSFIGNVSCPNCSSQEIVISTIHFPGIRVLCDADCKKCNTAFMSDLPTGFALYYPKSILKATGEVVPKMRTTKWFEKQLSYCYNSKNSTSSDIVIQKKTYIPIDGDVILLNCLDYLYGHVFLKLLNIQFYQEKQPSLKIIVLIPASFEWLIPDGVSEVWLVDIRLGELKKWQQSIHNFVSKEMKRFNKVFLSPVYPHLDLQKIKIENFTKISPFNIDNFKNNKLSVTFIYREDRLWHSNNLEEFLFLISQRYTWLKWTKVIFLYLQNKKIIKLLKKIKLFDDDIDITIAGLGKTTSFPKFIKDKRKTLLNDDIEKEWCKIYASSHVVIGVHGSNMLLPTALSGSFVEILPDSRIGNITQDVFGRYKGRMMLFLGRFVAAKSGVNPVVKHVINILTTYPIYDLYNSSKYVQYEKMDDVSEYGNIFSQISKKHL